jgi:integrase
MTAVLPSASDDPKSFVAIRGGIVDKWGHRPITEITRAEVIALLDDIVDRGAPVAANRTLAALRKLFNWAIERDILETSPTDRVKPPAAEKSRDRVLSDSELKALWHASEALGWPFGPMVQLLILTGQRREEVASMAWSEIDVDRGEWVLPRGRVKNDKAHVVPLGALAIAILHTVPRIAGADLVFTTTGTTPISGFSRAKSALDQKMPALLHTPSSSRTEEAAVLEPWRLHDIRRTVASGMARLGLDLAVIEKVLNHSSGTFAGIVGVYQRYEFAEEKRRALEAWGSFVASLVAEEPASNIVSLVKVRA